MNYSGIIVLLKEVTFNNIRNMKLRHTLTRAPITPSDVRRRYSKGRVFEVVLRNGYKNNGIWAIQEPCKHAEGRVYFRITIQE